MKQKSIPSSRWSSDSSVISKTEGGEHFQCFNVESIKKTKQKLTVGPCALNRNYTQTSEYHPAARIFRQLSQCFMKTFTRTQSCWLSNAFRSLTRRVFSSSSFREKHFELCWLNLILEICGVKSRKRRRLQKTENEFPFVVFSYFKLRSLKRCIQKLLNFRWRISKNIEV